MSDPSVPKASKPRQIAEGVTSGGSYSPLGAACSAKLKACCCSYLLILSSHVD